MGVKLQSALGGSVELNAPSTASNFTMTVPALDGTVIVQNSSGNVGIGTSTPYGRLDVQTASDTKLVVHDGDTAGHARLSAVNNLISNYQGIELNAAVIQFWTSGLERARITTAGFFRFDSGYGSAATAYGCRAWVNFNGKGTVAIRASGNVSSITDDGVGIYTVNFTTAMVDANYSLGTFACNGTNNTPAGLITHGNNFAPTVNGVQVKTVLSANYSAMDSPNVSVNIFR